MQILRCRVRGSNPEKQTFKIESLDGQVSINDAILVTNMPYDNSRAGRFENIKLNTIVMAMIDDRSNAYILGYVPSKTTFGTYGQKFKPEELGPGELREIDTSGSLFERKRSGVYRWLYNIYCHLTIDRMLQTLSATFNSVYLTMRTGNFKWDWNRIKDTTLVRLFMTRGYLPATEYDKTACGVDRLDLKVMDECESSDNMIEYRSTASGDGSVSLKVNIGTDSSVTVSINDKVSMVANESGVTITADKIMLGGAGNEQCLLTKAYYDNWASTHIHSNGNMGSPTGPPLMPIMPAALVAKGKTNWHTITTKAE